MIEVKMVSTMKYSMMMHKAANWQKLFNAIRDVIEPSRKAKAFVKEVIVIEGPACMIPVTMRSSTDLEKGV